MKKFNYIILFILINIINRTHLIEGAPDPPNDLSIEVKSGKNVDLNWKPPHDGIVSSYKVTIVPLSEQDETGVRTIRVGSSDALPISIRDLTPGASYEVQLHSVYMNKASNAFISKNFTTKPNIPGRLLVWFRNETTLLVLWQPPYPAGIFDKYRVSIIPEDATQSILYVDKETEPPGPAQAAFYGLIPGRAYNISVQTVSKSQLSEPLESMYKTVPLPQYNEESHSTSTPQTKASVPMFTNGGPPSEMSILEGRDAEIQCEANGTPSPAVEWFLNHSHKLDLTTSRKYQINEIGSLVITPLEKIDEAIYTCVRSNSLGSINGSTALHVIVRTHIDQPPVDSKVILSSTAELQCRVRHDSSVPIKIYWTFNGRNTTSSSRIKVMADGTLRIEQVRNTDVGLYTCRVESIGGTEKRSARLDVIELPQPPTHLAISNIGAFSVVLQFTPGFNGNASISKWIVESQLFKLRNANWSVIYESTNHTQNNAIVVHNLRPYTEYRLRLSPVNVVGRSLSPSETSPPFQTLQALPAGPPINVTLRTVSPTALRVRWTPLPPESWYGHPRGYNVTWSEFNDEGLHSTIHSFILDDYHSHSFLITSLEEFTRYGVQVFALNDVGSSTGSRLIDQRTNEATPSAGPDSVEVKATSSTTIVVEWGEITKVDMNGILQGFKVKYTSSKSTDSTQYKIIESNQTRTTTLTELKKYTTYRISVCAFTHAGDGVYSTSKTEQTFQDVPGPPSNVTLLDVTHTTARIQWDIPLEPNGEILAYRISYKMSDEDFKRAISREFISTDRTHRFLGLRPETYYIFEVTAKTSEGWGKAAKLIVIGSAIIETPYYRESWFVILCACLSVVITIMVIAVLCVRNKSYKYKQEAKKGSQDRLSEVGFGLDDNIENHYPTGFEMRQYNGLLS